MAVVSNSEILSTWRALAGNLGTSGWRSIDMLQAGSCRIKLARHSPGNEEAILVGFSSTRLAPVSQLPQGQGFRIERASLGEAGAPQQWLALVRQPTGSLELFAAVVADVAALLNIPGEPLEELLYQRLLGRVRGWQEFMRIGREGLGREAEQGLAGELCFLREVVNAGVLQYSAANAWKGPLDGLHDFLLGSGAIEVKSTLATEGFPVRIVSLDQLDDSQAAPLFLAALRLATDDVGLTLPEHVADIRNRLSADPAAMAIFESALHAAGYLDMHAEAYSRRFSVSELRILLVDSEFPRMIPFNVPAAARWAQYELDLSLLTADSLQLAEVLQKLGVI
ncbi:TPA: PD-(D/E)XK motif protein [Pseudomonas aeruginosa]|nr:PD-(D/E)XK motif protein [Pseudomonas aeruginosa]HEJ5270730.1 PD-(D/E)XK motif protein [Pseudomonas aeruginosa]